MPGIANLLSCGAGLDVSGTSHDDSEHTFMFSESHGGSHGADFGSTCSVEFCQLIPPDL